MKNTLHDFPDLKNALLSFRKDTPYEFSFKKETVLYIFL